MTKKRYLVKKAVALTLTAAMILGQAGSNASYAGNLLNPQQENPYPTDDNEDDGEDKDKLRAEGTEVKTITGFTWNAKDGYEIKETEDKGYELVIATSSVAGKTEDEVEKAVKDSLPDSIMATIENAPEAKAADALDEELLEEEKEPDDEKDKDKGKEIAGGGGASESEVSEEGNDSTDEDEGEENTEPAEDDTETGEDNEENAETDESGTSEEGSDPTDGDEGEENTEPAEDDTESGEDNEENAGTDESEASEEGSDPTDEDEGEENTEPAKDDTEPEENNEENTGRDDSADASSDELSAFSLQEESFTAFYAADEDTIGEIITITSEDDDKDKKIGEKPSEVTIKTDDDNDGARNDSCEGNENPDKDSDGTAEAGDIHGAGDELEGNDKPDGNTEENSDENSQENSGENLENGISTDETGAGEEEKDKGETASDNLLAPANGLPEAGDGDTYVNTDGEPAEKTETVKITWSLAENADTKDASDKEYLFKAQLPGGYELTDDIKDELQITVTLTENDFAPFRVETVSPSNAKINLFDYWLDDENTPDDIETQGREPATIMNKGINKGHALLFSVDSNSVFWDKGYGKWNAWTSEEDGVETPNKKPRQGLINPVLKDKEDAGEEASKFPELNIKKKQNSNETYTVVGSEEHKMGVITNLNNDNGKTPPLYESLGYLFDPDYTGNDHREVYEDVKGLLQIQEVSGNYYYTSRKNFAEFVPGDGDSESGGSFNIYNTYGVNGWDSKENSDEVGGQFFPFNTAEQVFEAPATTGGELTPKDYENCNYRSKFLNHYFGLTLEVEFQQPMGGILSVNNKPMQFQFSGDDDVWIFLDDVLVADLGGLHDELGATIDFSTGKILTGETEIDLETGNIKIIDNDNRTESTIKAKFEEALKSDGFNENDFRDDTFRGNTNHTLRLFYLERGNSMSNLSLSYNLATPEASKLIKYDQDGKPLKDVSFKMYTANEDYSFEEENGVFIGEITTGENGEYEFKNKDDADRPYEFDRHDYYVMKETDTPSGYRTAKDIDLYYDKITKNNTETGETGTNLLLVDNRWETGAMTDFSVSVWQTGSELKYGTSGDITGDDDGTSEAAGEKTVDAENATKGLIVAVPLLKTEPGNKVTEYGYIPVYGSPMSGFDYIVPEESNDKELATRKAILEAALCQIYGAKKASQGNGDDAEAWYLDWDNVEQRYNGTLHYLPGDAQRYYWANPDGGDYDFTMAYYFIDLAAINADDVFSAKDFPTEAGNGQAKIDALAELVEDKMSGDTDEALQAAVSEVADTLIFKNANTREKTYFGLLETGDFNRLFSMRLNIPNIVNRFEVLKTDENGNPLGGAEFSLYASRRGAENGGAALASGVTDSEGMLAFSATEGRSAGHSRIALETGKTYYLKETKAPDGYDANDATVAVQVTDEGVFADAGTADDGVSVRSGLGKLVKNMAIYASDGKINVTLRDIYGDRMTQPSGDSSFSTGNWKNENKNDKDEHTKPLELHYGLGTEGLDYGTHSGRLPYYETDAGYIKLGARQNYDAHKDEDNEYAAPANKYVIDEDTDMSGLFTGRTVVVVTNTRSNDPDTPDPEDPDKPHKPSGGGGGGGTPPGTGNVVVQTPPAPESQGIIPEVPGYVPPHPEYNKLPVMGDEQFGPGFVYNPNTGLNEALPAYGSEGYAEKLAESENGTAAKETGSLQNASAQTADAVQDGAVQDANANGERVQREIIPELKELYARNNDLLGWLTVPGTGLGYPVMNNTAYPEYYLHRTFDKKLDPVGIPFTAPFCDTDSDNILIHGHNMNKTLQFGWIWNYQYPAFRNSHPTIDFKTLYDGESGYEVMAVFFAPVYPAETTGVFKWYQYAGDMNKAQFDYYVDNVKALSMYETGVSAEYGDRLITLETCASSKNNTRLVVVARKKASVTAETAGAETGADNGADTAGAAN